MDNLVFRRALLLNLSLFIPSKRRMMLFTRMLTTLVVGKKLNY